MNQAVREIKELGGLQAVDVDRVARRYGIDAGQLRQRFGRAATFARSIENNKTAVPIVESAAPSAPRRGSGEKHRVQLRFRINGSLLKFYRQEFYRGELRTHTRRGSEQCVCGRDLIEHAVPVVSDAKRPALLCECGLHYEAEAQP